MEISRNNECMICGLSIQEANLLFKMDQYNFYQCTNCKFVFLDIKIRLEDKYALNEEKYGKVCYSKRPRALVREDRLALRQIGQFVSEGNMLEIGCNDGWFLIESKLMGWNVCGIEFSSGASKIAKRSLGETRVHCGTIHDCPFEVESFDIVIMKSLIEHVSDPRSEIQEAYRLLKPDGWLYILTPNIESFDAKLYKRHWFALVPGDHLWFFSPNTLKTLLEKNGFETAWLITTVSYEDTVIGMLFAARSLLSMFGKLSRECQERISEPRETFRDISQRTLTSGLSVNRKHILKMVFEFIRYANLPWFSIYSALISKTLRGACIRGIFQKKVNLYRG